MGLTYDVGKVVLLQYFPERYEETLQKMEKSGEAGRFFETEISLGFDESSHQEIGAYFLDFWNLPAVFVETALYHHTPAKASVHYSDVVEIVGLHRSDDRQDTGLRRGGRTGPRSPSPRVSSRRTNDRIDRGIRKRYTRSACNFPLPAFTVSRDSSSPR